MAGIRTSTPSTTRGGAIRAIRGTTGTGRYATTRTIIGIGEVTIRAIIRVIIRVITPASILHVHRTTAPDMVRTTRQQARVPRVVLSITTIVMLAITAHAIHRQQQIETMAVLTTVATVAMMVP